MSSWTNVPKPTRTASDGTPIAAGFFLFLTKTTSSGDWTSVPKPSSSVWSKVAKPSVVTWSPVLKPSESSITTFTYGQAEPIGMLLALTQSSSIASTSVISGWTDISKPSSSIWTKVSKPTT